MAVIVIKVFTKMQITFVNLVTIRAQYVQALLVFNVLKTGIFLTIVNALIIILRV